MQQDLMREIQRRESIRGVNTSLQSIKTIKEEIGEAEHDHSKSPAVETPDNSPDKKSSPPSEEAKTQI